MSDSDVYPPSASSTESCVTSYSSSREEREGVSTVQPYGGEPRLQTKISTKTDEDGFSPTLFRSRLEQKFPVTEYLVCYVCVLFSMAKSVLRMGSCVRFCCHNMLLLRTMCGEGSSRSVL